MQKYEVLVDGEYDAPRKAGDIIELDMQVAEPLIGAGKIKLADESAEVSAPREAATVAAPGGESSGVDSKAVGAPRVVTDEDIAANPILGELGAQPGYTVSVGAPEAQQ